MIRLGILGSTRGTSMQAIVEAIAHKQLSASIEIVASNKSDALILERATSFGLTTAFIDPALLTREQFDNKISALMLQYHVDLIVLVGYMRILSEGFIESWRNKIINVHPSLLPDFSGMMDLDVHRAVLSAGVSETGCTVHFVTKEVDSGPIVVQKRCHVLQEDTPESLKLQVQKLEGEALVEAITLIAGVVT